MVSTFLGGGICFFKGLNLLKAFVCYYTLALYSILIVTRFSPEFISTQKTLKSSYEKINNF